MRTLTTPKSRSTLIYRLLTVCVASAAISLSTFASVSQGEDPQEGTEGEITITYFGAATTDRDEWFIDGTLNAPDRSAVTITFGGAGAGITTTVDDVGYFSIDLRAAGGCIVTMEAADGTSTAQAEIELSPFFL